jgi:hypothetical protein
MRSNTLPVALCRSCTTRAVALCALIAALARTGSAQVAAQPQWWAGAGLGLAFVATFAPDAPAKPSGGDEDYGPLFRIGIGLTPRWGLEGWWEGMREFLGLGDNLLVCTPMPCDRHLWYQALGVSATFATGDEARFLRPVLSAGVASYRMHSDYTSGRDVLGFTAAIDTPLLAGRNGGLFLGARGTVLPNAFKQAVWITNVSLGVRIWPGTS